VWSVVGWAGGAGVCRAPEGWAGQGPPAAVGAGEGLSPALRRLVVHRVPYVPGCL
jgi:hypothetical protein